MVNTVEQSRAASTKWRQRRRLPDLPPLVGMAALVQLLCVSPNAMAEDIEGFERLMDRGHAELDKAKYDDALASFTEAGHLGECPTALYWAGQASEKLRQKAVALDYYQRAIHQKPSGGSVTPCFVKGKRDSEAAATALRPHLGWLDVTVVGATTPLESVTVNGVQRPIPPPPSSAPDPTTGAAAAHAPATAVTATGLPATLTFRLAVDPGAYSLRLAGAERAKGTLIEGQVQTVRIELAPVAAQASSAPGATAKPGGGTTNSKPESKPVSRATKPNESKPSLTPESATVGSSSTTPWAWGALGLGGAGVVLAGVSGWQVLRIEDELGGFAPVERCYDPCPQDYNDKLERGQTWATVANVAGAVGAVGLGVGLWLLLTDGPNATPAQEGSLRWSVTPASASAQVNW